MTITFTPNNSTVIVHFSASGNYNDNWEGTYRAYFNIVSNGTTIAGTKCIVGGNDGTADNLIWGTAMTYPVTVTPGTSTTIKIQWWFDDEGNGNYLTNSPATGLSQHRELTILDF